MKKILSTVIVLFLLLSCKTFKVDSNYIKLSESILENANSVEIKMGWWNKDFNSKEPDFVITDKSVINELAEILSETGYAYNGVLECGYSGSIIFNYSNNEQSPEIFFNENCGSFEFWLGDNQIAGYISKTNSDKLADLINRF